MGSIERKPKEAVIDMSVADKKHGAAAAADGKRATGVRPWPPLEPSIYRVPPWIRDLNSSAYTPQFVSFGPYHHGATERLLPMEKHKRDAVARFSRRANKSPDEIKAAVQGLVEGLMGSYDGLDEEWRENQGTAFLDLMIRDGCFMLEIILFNGITSQFSSKTSDEGYHESHPVFGRKGPYLMPHIRRDMLLLENQLPLKLLQELAQLLPPGEEQFIVPDMGLKFLASGKFLLEFEHGILLPPPTTLEALCFTTPIYYLDSLLKIVCMMFGMIRRLVEMTVVGTALSVLLSLVAVPFSLARAALSRCTTAHASPYKETLAPQLHVADDPLSRKARRCFLPCLPGREVEEAKAAEAEAIHILDMYKQSMLVEGDSSRVGRVPFSAEQLLSFGVKFQVADAGCFHDVEFGAVGRRRIGLQFFYVVPLLLILPTFRLPLLKVDDHTLPVLLNLMAFERFYHGTGNEVNNYLLMMGSLVCSVEDVHALFHHGIVLWGPGKNDESVHKIFAELMEKALPLDVAGHGKLYYEVADYCKSRTARIVRWFRRSQPPPLIGPIVSILAVSVALFSALQRYIFK